MTIASSPRVVQSAQYGYSITIPEGWHQVPDDVLDMTMRSVVRQDSPAPLIFDAAIQQSGETSMLQYPYVLTQILPYDAFGLKQQPNARQMERIVESITGAQPEEAMDQYITDDARDLVDLSSMTRPVFLRDEREIHWTLDMNVPGIGTVHGRMTGHFGRNAVVQVCCYAVDDEARELQDVFSSIVNSFSFDADHAYDDALAVASGGWMDGAARGGVIGGISGAVVAAFIAIRRKRTKA